MQFKIQKLQFNNKSTYFIYLVMLVLLIAFFLIYKNRVENAIFINPDSYEYIVLARHQFQNIEIFDIRTYNRFGYAFILEVLSRVTKLEFKELSLLVNIISLGLICIIAFIANNKNRIFKIFLILSLPVTIILSLFVTSDLFSIFLISLSIYLFKTRKFEITNLYFIIPIITVLRIEYLIIYFFLLKNFSLLKKIIILALSITLNVLLGFYYSYNYFNFTFNLITNYEAIILLLLGFLLIILNHFKIITYTKTILSLVFILIAKVLLFQTEQFSLVLFILTFLPTLLILLFYNISDRTERFNRELIYGITILALIYSTFYFQHIAVIFILSIIFYNFKLFSKSYYTYLLLFINIIVFVLTFGNISTDPLLEISKEIRDITKNQVNKSTIMSDYSTALCANLENNCNNYLFISNKDSLNIDSNPILVLISSKESHLKFDKFTLKQELTKEYKNDSLNTNLSANVFDEDKYKIYFYIYTKNGY